ncbi:MAG: RNA polymerase sigma factor [Gemmatimonadetes bacterium]|nr:MAG: RNA polymerase sigma factor [Gemmatimonadota bacterium]
MHTHGEPSDGAVVRAVLAGDSEQYRLLVRRYQDVLYRHAYRMVGRADDAADLTQRALVNGFRKLDRCRDPEKVGGWLFRIVANLCKDFLKSPRRQDVSVEATGADVIDAASPDDDLERAEVRRTVREALARLSPEQREAFVLKHVEGRSYEEMTELLGASKSALKMRVMRAREELQNLLKVYR